MSSILKALKKLEEEQARREGGGGDIARDILRGAQRRRGPRGWWLLPVGLVGGGVAVFAAFGLLSRTPNQGGRTTIPASEKANRAENPLQAPLTETHEAVVTGAAQRNATSPTAPAAQPAAGSGARRPPSEARASSVPPASMAGERAAAPNREVSVPVAEEASDIDRETEPIAGGESADLVLSGIALQDGNATGMAIINGLPVMEGTVIEGARVEAVLSDRVRLERGGEVFELLLRP